MRHHRLLRAMALCCSVLVSGTPARAADTDTIERQLRNLDDSLAQMEPRARNICANIQKGGTILLPCSEAKNRGAGEPRMTPPWPWQQGSMGWIRGLSPATPYRGNDPEEMLKDMEKRAADMEMAVKQVCIVDQQGQSVAIPCRPMPSIEQPEKTGNIDQRIERLKQSIRAIKEKLENIIFEQQPGGFGIVIRPRAPAPLAPSGPPLT